MNHNGKLGPFGRYQFTCMGMAQ